MSSFQTAAVHMIEGIVDSGRGLKFIYRFHKEQQEANHTVEQDEPMTTLARRRAENSKPTRETKSSNESSLLNRILVCGAFNGGAFLASIFLFNKVFMPVLQSFISWMFGDPELVWRLAPIVSGIFSTFWILPVFLISKITNLYWFQEISNAAYKKTRGRPQMIPSFGKLIADTLFSIVLQFFFSVQGMLASLLPIPGLGFIVHWLHTTLLYSLYSFEYRWFNMGWEVHMRLHHIEKRWPYFVGFGLPLAVATSLPDATSLPHSYVISVSVYAVLFPFFIISAIEADPKTGAFDFPLRIFSPVIMITNSVFQFGVKIINRLSRWRSERNSQPSSSREGND